jgi:hypothetical protein
MNIQYIKMDLFFKNIHKEQGRLILWMPIFFMVGIFIYFSLSEEPSYVLVLVPVVLSSLLIALFYKHPILRMVFISIFFSVFGFSVIFFKTHYLNTSMISKKMDAQHFKGVIQEQEYTPEKDSYKLVIALDHPIEGLQKVKLTYKKTTDMLPEIGDSIEGVATLLPFSDPVVIQHHNGTTLSAANGTTQIL